MNCHTVYTSRLHCEDDQDGKKASLGFLVVCDLFSDLNVFYEGGQVLGICRIVMNLLDDLLGSGIFTVLDQPPQGLWKPKGKN
ncbi:MAG: hypothetical protein Q9175_001518 [Cornicularia normoerica]